MYSTILVALDGSEYSAAASEAALALAQACGARLAACHVYGARLHNQRFKDMEPTLEAQYQDESLKKELREAHTGLISDGLLALSQGYMDDYLAQARAVGVGIQGIQPEGRNYLKILEAAREAAAGLIVLGAGGLGGEGRGNLGSTAARVLRHADADVLIARSGPGDGSIVLGIDGSPQALAGLQHAQLFGRLWTRGLELAAVYDPFFHVDVFQAMARSLPAERREEVGLSRQEGLHKRIIDDGLGSLYTGFLGAAQRQAQSMGLEVQTSLLKGKAAPMLLEQCNGNGAGLMILGRYGHHREGISLIGSNAEAVAAASPGNVLITGPVDGSVPGAGPRDSEAAAGAAQAPEALEVVLKKTNPLAPGFHRHMVKGRLRGGICRTGDKIMVFEVASTEPGGPVLVTEKTLIRFI